MVNTLGKSGHSIGVLIPSLLKPTSQSNERLNPPRTFLERRGRGSAGSGS